MTQIAVNHQIDIIQKATAEAIKSKASALQFLVDAGIIKKEQKPKKVPKRK